VAAPGLGGQLIFAASNIFTGFESTLVAATLACLMTACVTGTLYTGNALLF